MAESLLVRKGGGGAGIPVNYFERTFTISNDSYVDIKKGELVSLVSGTDNTLPFTASAETQLTNFGSTINYDQLIHVDEERMLTYYVSGTNVISYKIIKRVGTTVEISQQYTLVDNNSGTNSDNTCVSIGDNLFVFFYISTVISTSRITSLVFRLNDDGTITKGTTHQASAVDRASNRPINALALRNNFVFLSFSGTDNIIGSTLLVNRETLTLTTLAQATTLRSSSTFPLSGALSHSSSVGLNGNPFASVHSVYIVLADSFSAGMFVRQVSVNYPAGSIEVQRSGIFSVSLDWNFSGGVVPMGTNTVVAYTSTSTATNPRMFTVETNSNLTASNGDIGVPNLKTAIFTLLENNKIMVFGWKTSNSNFSFTTLGVDTNSQFRQSMPTPIDIFASAQTERFAVKKFNDDSFVVVYRNTGGLFVRFLYNNQSRITRDVSYDNTTINRTIGTALEDGVSGQSIKVAMFK
jgi:hypothetical protein